jgi:hypothetical protein
MRKKVPRRYLTPHWVKYPATAHPGGRSVRPGFLLSPLPSTRSNRDSLISLSSLVGAGEWRCPAGCASPAVHRLRHSESELWQLRRRSMTMSAGSGPPPAPPRDVSSRPPEQQLSSLLHRPLGLCQSRRSSVPSLVLSPGVELVGGVHPGRAPCGP